MKYSIISPTYNSFNEMKPLFASLEGQTRRDFEVIFVDDCSSDDTVSKLSSYCAAHFLDIPYKILHTPSNMGPGGARNIGMQDASGDWIVFLDSDDALDQNFCAVIDQLTVGTQINFVVYDSVICGTGGEQLRLKKSIYSATTSTTLSAGDIISGCIGGIRKCFKRELVLKSQVSFLKLKKAEDFIFYCELASKCDDLHAVYCDKPLYHIYQHSGSLSRGYDDRNVMKEVFAYLYSNVDQRYKEDVDIAAIRVYLYGGALQMAWSGVDIPTLRNYVDEFTQKTPNWYEKSKKMGLNRTKQIGMFLLHHKLFFAFKNFCNLQRFVISR